MQKKIPHGIINPMDKEEFIHVILRLKGPEEYFFIDSLAEVVFQTLENVLKVNFRNDRRLKV